MYAEGRGVPQDYVPAHMWFSLSAAQGEKKAAKTLIEMAERRMTPAQIAEAQKLARDWKPAKQPPSRLRNSYAVLRPYGSKSARWADPPISCTVSSTLCRERDDVDTACAAIGLVFNVGSGSED
ncbi:hypothetical protein [Bradyrhizobium cytisi]|uniref:hypothetical protein n=1 Tax=Bradyrhizobium cytisi TaxID=515489 RepID=UPI00322215FA